MDADVLLRLLLFFALLLMSGFFSGSETAMFSIGPVHLMRLDEDGHPRAPLLASLLAQPRRLIATIFIGNEFVNIGASALMATVTNHYLQEHGRAIVTLVSTLSSVLLILILGEVTPKNLAAKLPVRWALIAARPIWLLALVMTPLRWTIERIADIVVRLFGESESGQAARVGEEEFLTMVDRVSKKGELEGREQRLIHRIFEFGDRRVTDVMTKAEDVFSLSTNLTRSSIVECVRSQQYSRIPVYQGQRRDRVVGVLHAKDLVAHVHDVPAAKKRGLSEMLHPAYFVPKTTMCEQLFREFRRRQTHLALVVDEYGRFVGLVTMEDLLEEMFGEISDEKEQPPPEGVERGDADVLEGPPERDEVSS
ncbi:MAG: HlyC/CorC family transporter [Myxococcales bacterium]|nr:HlyC/CorC family transporter [Myxococcales bacterium]